MLGRLTHPSSVSRRRVSSPTVKFLVAQFALYALASLVVGAVAATLWWRPLVAQLRREHQRAAAHRQALEQSLAESERRAAADRATIESLGDLVGDLHEVRRALTMVEAELEAGSMHQSQATARVAELEQTVEGLWADARNGQAAVAELQRMKSNFAERLEALRAERDRSERLRADALARATLAEQELVSLRSLHAVTVQRAQAERSALELRADRAEAALKHVAREQQVLASWAPAEHRESEHAPEPSVLVDLTADGSVIELTEGSRQVDA